MVVDVGSSGASRSGIKETLDSLYSVSSSGGFLTGYGVFDNSGLEINNGMAATTNTGMVFINGPAQCNSATINGPLYVYDPGDANATTTSRQVEITVEGGDPAAPAATWSPPPHTGLAVLPALFRYGPDHAPDDFAGFAEPQGGQSENVLTKSDSIETATDWKLREPFWNSWRPAGSTAASM